MWAALKVDGEFGVVVSFPTCWKRLSSATVMSAPNNFGLRWLPSWRSTTCSWLDRESRDCIYGDGDHLGIVWTMPELLFVHHVSVHQVIMHVA
eukprot:674196_1